jgi:hypothetical protein
VVKIELENSGSSHAASLTVTIKKV